jgi:predicted enzyme related to lactoylglutathione lyase
MGEVTSYPNGTFCWVDLGTPDVAGAKAFYGGLFGWDLEDAPGADGAYVMASLNGRAVTGIHEHSMAEGAEWSSSVSVDDADAATARAAELGATVEMEPRELPGTSRMSVIRDPSGARVSLWQATGFAGAGVVNDVGAWNWNELVTPDLDAAATFYDGLFGWKAEIAPAPVNRGSLTMGELLIGGLHAPNPAEDPTPRWTVSFTVADADAAAARVAELGGSILLPPMDIPVGRFSVAADPAGAAFTLTAFPGGAFGGVDGS